MGAISAMSSDSQAMGRVGEVITRTWQTADKVRPRSFGNIAALRGIYCSRFKIFSSIMLEYYVQRKETPGRKSTKSIPDMLSISICFSYTVYIVVIVWLNCLVQQETLQVKRVITNKCSSTSSLAYIKFNKTAEPGPVILVAVMKPPYGGSDDNDQ